MSPIDFSKYTFVSTTFASVKDDPSVIHVVPTISESNKKWESRPITNPYQFSCKWSDMVEDDEEEEEFIDVCDPKYYESFLVGSVPSTKETDTEVKTAHTDTNFTSESSSSFVKFTNEIPTGEDCSNSAHNTSLESESTFSTLRVVENINSKLEYPIKNFTSNETIDSITELSLIIEEMRNELFSTKNDTTTQNFYCSELFPESEILSGIDDSSYIYIDYTADCVKNIYEDLAINKGLLLNDSYDGSRKKATVKDNHKEYENNPITKFSENFSDNFLSYIDTNLERKYIILSLEQVNKILEIIDNYEKIKENSEKMQMKLNQISFGQLRPNELFDLSASDILAINHEDGNDQKINIKKLKNLKSNKNIKAIKDNIYSQNKKKVQEIITEKDRSADNDIDGINTNKDGNVSGTKYINTIENKKNTDHAKTIGVTKEVKKKDLGGNIKQVNETSEVKNILDIDNIKVVKDSTEVKEFKDTKKNENAGELKVYNGIKNFKSRKNKSKKISERKKNNKKKNKKNKCTNKSDKSFLDISKEHRESKENLENDRNSSSFLKNKDAEPLSEMSSSKLNKSSIANYNNILNRTTHSTSSSPSSTYVSKSTEKSKNFTGVQKLFAADDRNNSLTFDNSQIFCESTEDSFEQIEFFDRNDCSQIIKMKSEATFHSSLPIKKKNGFLEEEDTELFFFEDIILDIKVPGDPTTDISSDKFSRESQDLKKIKLEHLMKHEILKEQNDESIIFF